jgi:hypothetical protein
MLLLRMESEYLCNVCGTRNSKYICLECNGCEECCVYVKNTPQKGD